MLKTFSLCILSYTKRKIIKLPNTLIFSAVASYDELYGKMRQHRMLREELREKKKELEFMMKKDRPRKQYFRNQDNQSDNISFSNKSDPFG